MLGQYTRIPSIMEKWVVLFFNTDSGLCAVSWEDAEAIRECEQLRSDRFFECDHIACIEVCSADGSATAPMISD